MAGLVVAGLVHALTENRRSAAGGYHRLGARFGFAAGIGLPPAAA